MATIVKQKINRYGGMNSNILQYPEASGQSFKAGQILYLNTSGQVAVTADGGVLAIGIANQDASGTANTLIDVDVIRPGDWFEITCYHATAASAVMADANVGDLYQLISVSNVAYLDKSATSTNMFKVVARKAQYSATDTFPRLIVCVLTACLQSQDAAQG